jgi:excisionase family DNA binding protein
MAERWPALLTRAEAAEYLGVSIETISREKAAGKIKSVWLRGAIKYRREDLDQYIRDLPEGSGEFKGAETLERRRSESRNSKRVSKRGASCEPAA